MKKILSYALIALSSANMAVANEIFTGDELFRGDETSAINLDQILADNAAQATSAEEFDWGYDSDDDDASVDQASRPGRPGGGMRPGRPGGGFRPGRPGGGGGGFRPGRPGGGFRPGRPGGGFRPGRPGGGFRPGRPGWRRPHPGWGRGDRRWGRGWRLRYPWYRGGSCNFGVGVTCFATSSYTGQTYSVHTCSSYYGQQDAVQSCEAQTQDFCEPAGCRTGWW